MAPKVDYGPGPGRPTKLLPDLQKQFVAMVAEGNYLDIAAAYVGINAATLHDWLRRGARERVGIYREFHDETQKALAYAERRDLRIIAEAAKTQWQAAAWRLERRFPGRWARQDRVKQEITGRDGGPILIGAADALEVRMAELASRVTRTEHGDDDGAVN